MSIEQKKERLADLLRQYQVRNGLTGRALARKLGLNPASLLSYIDAISFPSPETREKIARGVGMTPPELEAYLDNVSVAPLQSVEQIKQDVRALNREDFLEVAEAVFERLVTDLKSLS